MKLENGLQVHPIPKKVIIAEDVDAGQEKALQDSGLECERFTNTKDQDALRRILVKTGAHIAITRTSTVFGREAMDGTGIQAVQGACKGPHVDKAAAQDLGIEVLKVDSNREQVVNLTLGTLDGMATGLLLSNNMGRQNMWGKSTVGEKIFDLEEQRLGIVGYGDIGRRLAESARARRIEVWTFSHGHDVERQYDRDLATHIRANGVHRAGSLEELMARVNILSLHIDETDAHGKSNKGFMTAERLRSWKAENPRIFINIARGDVGPSLEELNELLKAGSLSYAMVDAHKKELEADGKFKLPDEVQPGLITSAHIGGSGAPVTRKTSLDVAETLRNWIKTGGFPETRVYVHVPLSRADLLSEGVLGLRLARTTHSGVDAAVKGAIKEAGFNFLGDEAVHDRIPGKRQGPENNWRVVPHVLALDGNGDTEAHMMDLISKLDAINADERRIVSARFIPTTNEMRAMINATIQ